MCVRWICNLQFQQHRVTITTIPENVSIQEFHSRPFRSDAIFKRYVLQMVHLIYFPLSVLLCLYNLLI